MKRNVSKSRNSLNRRSGRRENFKEHEKNRKITDEQIKSLKELMKKKESFRNNKNRKERYTNVNRVNFEEFLKKLLKYLVEGLSVGVVGMVLVMKNKKGNVNFENQIRDVTVLAITAASVFAILDMWAPNIAGSTRQGAGFGLGARMVGFPNLR